MEFNLEPSECLVFSPVLNFLQYKLERGLAFCLLHIAFCNKFDADVFSAALTLLHAVDCFTAIFECGKGIALNLVLQFNALKSEGDYFEAIVNAGTHTNVSSGVFSLTVYDDI